MADTAFMLAAAGLVLLMTPGLALFYGGMVRGKNVLGTIRQCFFMIALIPVEWVYLGYSMSFGPDAAIVIGLLAGVVCFPAVRLKSRFHFDDSLDVVGSHGVGGVMGTLCLGGFFSTQGNPGGVDGLLAGNAAQL